MIKEATAALINGKDLTYEQANAVINEIMNGETSQDVYKRQDLIRIFFLICLHTGADVHTPWCKIVYCFFDIFRLKPTCQQI